MGVDAVKPRLHNAPRRRERSLARAKSEPVVETGLLGGKMTKNLLLMTCASSAMVLMASASHAATAAATDNSQTTTNVTEIVVIAEKREQNLQKVPVAVSVLTGSERDTLGLESIQDVTNFAPGFTYDPGNVHAYIRGIGRQSANLTNDARVSNYEDDLFVPYPYQLGKSDLFLSQEQIEDGPQNVGGKEVEGGSIDEISVRPTDQPYAEVRARVANFGTYNVEAAVSGQVAPGLDLRLAAYDKNQDQGWWNNVANGVSEGNVIHEWYVEGQADWKPNDQTELWLRGFSGGWNDRGDAGARSGFNNGDWDETNLTDPNEYLGAGLFVNPNFGYAAMPGSGAQAAALANPTNGTTFGPYIPTSVSLLRPGITNNPSLADQNNFASVAAGSNGLNSYNGLSGVFTYDFPGIQLKYIAGFQQYDYYLNSSSDTDVTSYTMGLPALGGLGTVTGLPALVINPLDHFNYQEDDQYWDNEISLQSTDDKPLQWTVGLFYYNQHYTNPVAISAPQQPNLAAPMSYNNFLTQYGEYLYGLISATQFLEDPLTTPRESNPNNDFVYQNYDITYQDTSGYGQVSYKLNDQFKVTGDVRYSYDNKSGWEQSRDVLFGYSSTLSPIDLYGPILGEDTPAIDVTPSLTCATGNRANCSSGPLAPGVTSIGVYGPNGYVTRGLGTSSGAVTGGAGIQWTPTSDIFLYGRYERGYAAGTLNAGYTSAAPLVQPEYLNAYEVGYKETFGKALLIDVEGFYYDYDDMQVPISVAVGGLTEGQFINVPKAVSTGVDFTAYWAPVNNLVVTLVYSFDYTSMQTKCFGTLTGGVLTPAANAVCVVDTSDPDAVAPGANPYPGQTPGTTRDQGINGNPLPNAPENKLGLDVAYTWKFEPGAFTLSGSFVYRDSQVGAIFDRSYDTAPGWTGFNLRGLWKGPGDKYEVIAYVDNIFNSTQYIVGPTGAGLLGTNNTVATPAQGLAETTGYEIGPPRTFGVEVRYKFF
jgi:iron complex outermembrane receptor protein